MKKSLIPLLFCLITLSTNASDVEPKTNLMPKWKKGEKLEYTIIKTRTKSQAGVTNLKTQSKTPLNIEVVEANDNGYILNWTTGETTIEDPIQASNPIVKAMTNITKDFTIVLQLDSHATITQVVNWKELQEYSRTTINTLLNGLKNSGIDDKMLGMIRMQIESMYASREQIEQLCTSESQMFFVTLGRTYSLSTPINYNDRLPNPFGGDPIPSKASFTLEKVDTKSNTAVITWKQKIDPVVGTEMIENTMRELAIKMGKPIPDSYKSDLFNIIDHATFTHHLSSGWPQEIKHTRKIKTDDASQIDTLNFIQKVK